MDYNIIIKKTMVFMLVFIFIAKINAQQNFFSIYKGEPPEIGHTSVLWSKEYNTISDSSFQLLCYKKFDEKGFLTYNVNYLYKEIDLYNYNNYNKISEHINLRFNNHDTNRQYERTVNFPLYNVHGYISKELIQCENSYDSIVNEYFNDTNICSRKYYISNKLKYYENFYYLQKENNTTLCTIQWDDGRTEYLKFRSDNKLISKCSISNYELYNYDESGNIIFIQESYTFKDSLEYWVNRSFNYDNNRIEKMYVSSSIAAPVISYYYYTEGLLQSIWTSEFPEYDKKSIYKKFEYGLLTD